jgi:hypothetical protein
MNPIATASAGAPASTSHGAERGRSFPCDRCGAELELRAGGAALRCGHCGAEHPLTVAAGAPVEENDLRAALARQVELRKARTGTAAARVELACRACGAAVTFEGTLTSTFCSFCGVPVQRADARDAGGGVPVDAVLPFAVEGPAARAAVAAWVRGRWCAPGDFKRRAITGDVQGVYLPYFTFDAMTATEYAGERGEHYTVKVGSGEEEREEQRTRWSPASGSFHRSFDDQLLPAFRSLPQKLLRALEPWPLERCLPFTPEALAGKLAHCHDVPLDECFAAARKEMEEAIADEVEERIGGDDQRVHSIRTGWAGLTYRQLLLPVWLLAYRYRARTYRVAVNACTGEVVGERPWSAGKVVVAVLTLGVSLLFWR